MERYSTAGAAAGLLLLFVACGPGSGGGGDSSGQQPPEDVQVVRDVYGVPHVFAQSEKGALYGAGYAAAQDRMFQMCWTRLMYQGRVAEFFGPGTQFDPNFGGMVDANVLHDRTARLMGWARHAQRVAQALDDKTRARLQAYADGVNAWLADPQATFSPLFAQYGVPRDPWTVADCVGVWLRLARQFGADGLDEARRMHEWESLKNDPNLTYEERLDQLLGPRVCDDSAVVVQQSDVPLQDQQALADYALQHGLDSADANCTPGSLSPSFSQAWAVAGERTTTGLAVLVGDPRIDVSLPNTFFEWSMQCASFTVRGIGVAGSPNVLCGSTADLAWSPTALGMDQADLFLLRTDAVAHPGQYRYDGKWIDYAPAEDETILVQGEAPKSVTYRETAWGPVVTEVTQDALAGEEFAVHRVPFDDPSRDPSQAFFELYRAADRDEFFAALAGWTFPSVNLVFADAAGRIGYSVVGEAPVRNPGLELAGIIAQDGGTSSSGWIDSLSQSLKPHVFDPASGFVSSANNRPVGSWYPIPIRFGSHAAGDTHRSRRLRERLAGGPAIFAPADVTDVHHDVVNATRRDIVEIGLWLRDHPAVFALSSEATSAVDALESWWQAGARMDEASAATVLASFLDLRFRKGSVGPVLSARYGGGENGMNFLLKNAIAAIHDGSSGGPGAEEAGYVDLVLSTAWSSVQDIGSPAVWQSWYRDNVLTFTLETWKSIEGLPSLEPGVTEQFGPVRAADSGTVLSPREQSYTQFFSPGSGDTAQSVLPPGAHESAWPHARDQVPLWIGEGFKPSPYSFDGAAAMGSVTVTNLVYLPGS